VTVGAFLGWCFVRAVPPSGGTVLGVLSVLLARGSTCQARPHVLTSMRDCEGTCRGASP